MTQQCEASGALRENLLPWFVCLSASLLFFYEFIQGNMFASIADDVMRIFQVRADKMAWLSSSFYVSNVLFLLVAGFILDRFSTRKIIMIAMAFCVASTFALANTHSFYVALFCRFVMGAGSAFCFLGPVRLASCWFPSRRMAMVTGVIITLAMTGGMVAQYPLTRLIAVAGWQQAMMQVGWLGIILLFVMYFGIIDKTGETNATRHRGSLFGPLGRAFTTSKTLRPALYTSLMNMAIAVFGAMMGTLYLVQRLGVGREEASFTNSMLFLGAIAGGPFIGWFSDRLGLRVLPMKLAAIASLVVMMAVLYLPVSLSAMNVLFFLLGFFTAGQVISYALVAEATPAAMTATSLSVISLLTQGGYIVYQNIFSHLLVAHGPASIVNHVPVYSLGNYQFAALMLPVGLVMAWLALSGLKETRAMHTGANR